MHTYELQYETPADAEVVSHTFEAYTLGGALDVAKRVARGEWARLYEDGRPVCRLELVGDNGVWLVGGLKDQDEFPKVRPSAQPA